MDNQLFKSSLNALVIRLKPKEDLKKSIIELAVKNKIKAGVILTCVGSLEQINLRFANQKNGEIRKGYFEIVSLTGTFSDSGCHLHISVSDNEGNVVGGHLLDENLIYTTAEICLVELNDLQFKREVDSTYGYQELSIRKRE
ncbi:MAG: DNA-binding protein [Cyclobacteriaceae bacterium]